ncbi:transposable element Tcb2 transposase [Trichonephila clavipes]|nr:transposable element Tcb2 transposase [Trichonephila clavipes]
MRGTLTGQRYVDDILRPHVGPFLNGLPGAIFQQDNARPHTARVAQDFLCHFQTFPWPARFPDLSPVEHVWDQLKRQLSSCHSVHDFELAVQDLWASASGQHKVSNQLNAGPCGGMVEGIEDVQYEMNRISNKLKELKALHEKNVTRPSLDDSVHEEKEIENVSQEITRTECLNQMRKEEKSFMKEKKKKN